MSWRAIYHPPEKEDLAWGLQVIDAGYTEVRPDSAYPPHHHPDRYLFSWEKGRILSEYQIVMISRGAGVLETTASRPISVQAGDVFLLFPGEWHRYRPVQGVGWREQWVGFTGQYVQRLMQTFFLPQSPILKGGATPGLTRQMKRIIDHYQNPHSRTQPLLNAELISLIAHLIQFAKATGAPEHRQKQEKIFRIRQLLLEQAFGPIDLEQVVRQQGLGYSAFRKAFKEQTGYAPHAYLLEVRLNRAQALLRQTDLSVTEISARLGFSSVLYFIRFFTRRMKQAPGEWRKRA